MNQFWTCEREKEGERHGEEEIERKWKRSLKHNKSMIFPFGKMNKESRQNGFRRKFSSSEPTVKITSKQWTMRNNPPVFGFDWFKIEEEKITVFHFVYDVAFIDTLFYQMGFNSIHFISFVCFDLNNIVQQNVNLSYCLQSLERQQRRKLLNVMFSSLCLSYK